MTLDFPNKIRKIKSGNEIFVEKLYTPRALLNTDLIDDGEYITENKKTLKKSLKHREQFTCKFHISKYKAEIVQPLHAREIYVPCAANKIVSRINKDIY